MPKAARARSPKNDPQSQRLRRAIARLEPAIKQWQSDALGELEGRLLHPRLDMRRFHQLMLVLERCVREKPEAWTKRDHTTVDQFHAGGARASAGRAIRKTRLARQDFSYQSGWKVRVQLKRETPIALPDTKLQYVRVKQRSSFRLRQLVSVDLTRVWSGGSEASARAKPCEFEVEVELLRSEANLASSPRRLALVLLQRFARLFPSQLGFGCLDSS